MNLELPLVVTVLTPSCGICRPFHLQALFLLCLSAWVLESSLALVPPYLSPFITEHVSRAYSPFEARWSFFLKLTSILLRPLSLTLFPAALLTLGHGRARSEGGSAVTALGGLCWGLSRSRQSPDRVCWLSGSVWRGLCGMHVAAGTAWRAACFMPLNPLCYLELRTNVEYLRLVLCSVLCRNHTSGAQ